MIIPFTLEVEMGEGDYCLSITRGIYTRVGGHGFLQQFTSGTLYLDDHEKNIFLGVYFGGGR